MTQRREKAESDRRSEFVPGVLLGAVFGGSLIGVVVRFWLRFDFDEAGDTIRVLNRRLRQAERLHPGSTKLNRR